MAWMILDKSHLLSGPRFLRLYNGQGFFFVTRTWLFQRRPRTASPRSQVPMECGWSCKRWSQATEVLLFFTIISRLTHRWLLSPINETQEIKLLKFITKSSFSLQFQLIQCLRHASCPWQACMFHSLAWPPTFLPASGWKNLGQFPEIKSTLEDGRFTT